MEFIDVLGFEGLYQVNKQGVVKSLKTNKILSAHKTPKGYFSLKLYKDNKRHHKSVHRLVAEVFVDGYCEESGKVIVNHKDGDKTNNNSLNLEWATTSENVLHAYRSGLIKDVSNINKILSKYGCIDVYDLNGVLVDTIRAKDDVIRLGFNPSDVYRNILGVIKTHKKHVFKVTQTN